MGILCYHTVDDSFTSRLSMSSADFEVHCRWLAAERDVVDLATAVELMDDRGRLPSGTVALTFDDGLAGLYDHALPSLLRHGLPATVFLVGGTLVGEHEHVDWVDGTPPGQLTTLSPEQVLEMAAAGIAFGSHSHHHHDLRTLDPDVCEQDLRHSREVLEELLGRPVPYLAYPRGRHDAMVRDAAERAGYAAAFTLPEAGEEVSPFSLPRVGVYAHNGLAALRLKSSRNYLSARTGRAYPLLRAVKRRVRRPGTTDELGAAPGQW